MKLSQEERKCLQALRTSEYEKFKDRNPNRLEGTCQWILQHENFQNWRDNSLSLLWVSADPGCGKSVFSKSLIDEDIRSTETRTTCYFFFKDDNEIQKNITTALSALLHQLFSQKPILITHAMSDYAVDGDKLPQSFHKLWSVLTKAVVDSKAGEVVCILDALDECAEEGRYQFIDAVNTFCYRSTVKQSKSQLKFFVTSRPYLDIERRFMKPISNFSMIRLHGEKESAAIGHEIDAVIRWRVRSLGLELELENREQSTLERELLGMKHRTYLWLKLIFEVIRNEVDPTTKKLRQIICTLPHTVDQAYETILLRGKDQTRARKLLHIIVAATRPLTLKEMNIALAIQGNNRSPEDLNLGNEARFESVIRNICGFFVTIIDQKVYLIHQTAKEFLVAGKDALAGQWKNSLDPVESELVMVTACITYLNFDIFEKESDSEDESNDQATKQHDFYNYAASFWATHFKQAQSKATRELLQSVLQICDTQSQKFWSWFSKYWETVDVDMDNSCPNFTSSLMVESYLGHESIVELLLETGMAEVDLKDNCDRTPLSWGAGSWNETEAVVKLLLETDKVSIDSQDDNSRTPLSWVTENGNMAVIKLLLKIGKIDVDLKDKDGRTPLSYAGESYKESEVVIKLLLTTGKVVIDLKDNRGRTSLSYIVGSGDGKRRAVKLLLKTGMIDVNLKDKVGRTSLSYAIRSWKKNEERVRLLLKTGKVDVDLKNNYDRTPLS